MRGVYLILLLSVVFSPSVVLAQSVPRSSFEIAPSDACPKSESKKALKYLEEGMNRKNGKEDRVEALRKALEEDADLAHAEYLLGLELLKTALSRGASLSAAFKHLKAAVDICPEFHFEPYYYLGAISLGKRDYDASVGYYKKYIEMSGESLEPLDDKREREMLLDLEYATFFSEAYKNPKEFNPEKVEGVCTNMDEFLPLISPDDRSMLLTRRYGDDSQVKATYGSETTTYVEKFVNAKKVNAKFEEGQPLPPPFNENPSYHYGGATLSIDNKHLFITICKPASMGYTNCDIYTADLTYGTDAKTGITGYHWSELRNLGEHINTSDGWEAQPSLSADGKTLYFASARADSRGIDIYSTTKGSNGNWQDPVNLGEPINTEFNDKTPFIHTDSRTLYFASDGHLGFGGYDVFYAKQAGDGSWGKPENLGHPINTESDEQAFAVSTDGRRVYYSAKDEDGNTGIDIYSFELYKEARPDQVLFVSGQIKDEAGKPLEKAVVELKTMQSKAMSKVDVDPSDGKYAAVVALRGDEKVVLNVKAEGKAFQSKLIEVVPEKEVKSRKPRIDESYDQQLNTFQDIELDVSDAKAGGVYRINDIFYKTNSAEISEKSKIILDEFAAYLNEQPKMRVAIHGHTDNVGNDKANLALSADRAFSVKQYLEMKGVAANRLEYKGFGETVPFADNATEEGRAQNRRTEFLILSQ